ncbi:MULTISPECIES: hypothetical protein [Mesorhizobium]|uniref:hypothetical protein n=1 Tax=Mesorhizobium TaxID=68287 RepID=UPI0010129A7B|nr:MULTISPECIES: hypothetical protein [Mesorhizobium]
MQSFFCVMKVGRDRPLSCRQYGELNRRDWLAEMNYTLAEAIERVGPVWLTLIPKAARELEYEDERAAGKA